MHDISTKLTLQVTTIISHEKNSIIKKNEKKYKNIRDYTKIHILKK